MVVRTLRLKNFPVFVSKSVDSNAGWHNHKHYEIVYVCNGMVEHIINGEHHVLREGNYFLLAPGDVHRYIDLSREPFSIINFLFDPSFIDASFTIETPFKEIIKHPLIGVSHKKLTALPLATQFSDDSGNLRAVFMDSFAEYRQKKLGHMNALKANLVKIILACLRNVSKEDNISEKSAFIDNIIKYVNDNYSENINLSSLCEKLGYNVQYVSRVFKMQIGVNFSDYLKKVRVQKACSLLLSTDMTVQQVVNAVGYSNMAFFYKAFREIIGETPAEFRNK